LLRKFLLLLASISFLFAKDIRVAQLFNMSLEEIMQIEVTSSTKTKKNLTQAPSIMSIFSADDIKKLGARTLSDVLFRVAGVQVQARNNGRSGSWFRGVQSEFNNKILFLIDNVPVKNVFGGFPADEEIPLELVKRIEIIKGPGSALYGANAFSGVINIYTYRPGELDKSYSIRTQIGSQNTKVASIWIDEEIFNTKLLLEAKGYQTDGEDKKYDRKGNPNTYTGEQKSKYARIKLASEDNKLLASLGISTFDNTRTYKGDAINNYREHENIRANIEYKDTYANGDASYYLNAYYTKTYRFEVEDVYTDRLRTDFEEAFSFDDNIEHIGLSANTTFKFSSHELLVGIDFQKEILTDSYFTDKLTNQVSTFVQDSKYNNFELDTYSIYIQDTYTFNENNTQLTIGLRDDYISLFDNQFNYRIGLTHKLNENIFSKFLFGTAYRTPSMIEYVRAPIGAELPNVEEMETYEAQIGYKTNNSYYTLTAFYNSFKNLISRKNALLETGATLDEEQFGNLDDQTMYGLEFESNYFINSNFSGFTNASYMKTKSDSIDDDIPLVANWTLATGIDWSKKVGIGQLLIHNDLIIYGNREDWPSEIWDAGQAQRYPGRDDDFSDAFAIWNAGIHYNIKRSNKHEIDISLTVNNLLDEEYYTQNISVPSSSREAFWDYQYDQRHIRLSLAYSW